MVEAVGVEPTSEKTFDKERSCFSHVLFCLVAGTKNGQRCPGHQSDRSHHCRPDGTALTSLLCDDWYPPIGEAEAIGYLIIKQQERTEVRHL
jgi:hypothetical protein